MRLDVLSPSEWTPAFLSGWDALLGECAEASVFQTPEWIGAWWRVFGAGLEARLITARDDRGGLLALAPFYLRRLRGFGGASPRILALMADIGAGSEYLGVVCRPGTERDFLDAVAARLAGEWDFLDLRCLREPSALERLAPETLGRSVSRLVHRQRHACYCVTLPGDFETYLASLHRDFRATVRRRTNKLLKSLPTRLLRTEREEDLDAHLERMFQLHQRRWNVRGEPGVFGGAEKRAFYRDFARAFLRRGWLRFYHLEVEGVIRASQFGFAYRGVFHQLQEAFDPDYSPPGIASLGVVLRAMVIRECIGEGLTAYDFLGWEGEVKSRWGPGVHHVQRLQIAAPGFKGALAFAIDPGWRLAKRWGRDRAPDWLLRVRHSWREAAKRRRVAGLAR